MAEQEGAGPAPGAVGGGGRPSLSIVVPALDAEATIGACLDAACSQTLAGIEVVVVDGGSRDRTVELARARPCRVVVDASVAGPAHGRNRGAAEARGDVVLFVDADVVLAPEAAERAMAALSAHPEAAGVNGVYEPEPANDPQTAFSRYLALQKHVTFASHATFTHLTTACGAVRRSALEAAGGFDERFRELEDLELGYRVAERGDILLDTSVRCRHFFRPFGEVARRYFRRTLYWLALFRRTRRFGSGITTRGRGLGAVCALIGAAMLPASAAARSPSLALAALALLALAAASHREVYAAALRREGAAFAAYCVLASLALASVAGAAAALYPLLGPSIPEGPPGGAPRAP